MHGTDMNGNTKQRSGKDMHVYNRCIACTEMVEKKSHQKYIIIKIFQYYSYSSVNHFQSSILATGS